MLDVVPVLSSVDFVKLDIEGSEWGILQDPRFAACAPRVLAMEYHTAGEPISEASARVSGLLAAAGYEITHGPTGADAGTLWASRI
jgi:hypothetical protein